MLALLPCLAGGTSAACCAVNAGASVCCSLASCFGCKWSPRLAKLTYVLIFGAAASLAIILRYWGSESLSWVSTISSSCAAQDDGQSPCWGAQAAYRISFATAIFFAFLAALTAVAPVTHLAGWLVKLLLFVGVLLLSLFLLQNDDMTRYAEAARVFSVLFLLAQALLIVDLAYSMHEWLLRRIEAREAAMARAGWEPGLCSNGWKVLYLTLSSGLLLASLAGLGVMYHFLGVCSLNQFFISLTLILGVLPVFLVALGVVPCGIMPPTLILTYSVYLLYGALTNNPDGECNAMARSENQNAASIFAGLPIAVISVTWMAVSSAGSLPQLARKGARASSGDAAAAAGAASVHNPAAGAGKDGDAVAVGGAAAAYQAAADGSDDEESGRSRSRSRAGSEAEDATAAIAATKPWAFHLIMCLAGFYIAMLSTNWGSPAASQEPAGNPELSEASMWTRIGTQWAIFALFVWTLVAPRVCRNRDFS